MNRKNLLFLKKKLDDEIGDDDSQALLELVTHSKELASTTDIQKSSNLLAKDIEDTGGNIIKAVKDVKESVSNLKLEIPKEQNVTVRNFPDPVREVTVTNLRDVPATTFPEIKIPEEVSIRQGWLSKGIDTLQEATRGIAKQVAERILRVKIVDTSDPAKPVSVRLSDGKRFYNALMSVATSGRYSPFKTAAGVNTEALVDADGHLQVDADIVLGDNINTSPRYNTNAIDDTTTTSVTYICKEGASTADWWFIKISETGSFPVFTHATVTNNPTVLTYADAYTARATTLVYSNYNAAF
jgi:hypothetical protein